LPGNGVIAASSHRPGKDTTVQHPYNDDDDDRDVERILDQQLRHGDTPVVIAEDGTIHPASDGSRGLSIHDASGDY
jgi:hypothetical protein